MFLHSDIALSIAHDRHAHDRRLAAAISRIRNDRHHFSIRHRIGHGLIHLGHRLSADPAPHVPRGSSHVSV
jgi:hypothetical protein